MLPYILEYLLFQCTRAEHYMYHAIPSKTCFPGPIVVLGNGYPSSGGGPNATQRRAIFTTIVQLDKPIAT